MGMYHMHHQSVLRDTSCPPSKALLFDTPPEASVLQQCKGDDKDAEHQATHIDVKYERASVVRVCEVFPARDRYGVNEILNTFIDGDEVAADRIVLMEQVVRGCRSR